MKKIFLFLVVLISSVTVFSQEITSEDSTLVNQLLEGGFNDALFDERIFPNLNYVNTFSDTGNLGYLSGILTNLNFKHMFMKVNPGLVNFKVEGLKMTSDSVILFETWINNYIKPEDYVNHSFEYSHIDQGDGGVFENLLVLQPHSTIQVRCIRIFRINGFIHTIYDSILDPGGWVHQ